MGILQISLTIWAWRRGWKGFALLPYGLGFLLGFFAPDLGLPDEGAFPWIIEFTIVGILIVMIALPRRQTAAGVQTVIPSQVNPNQSVPPPVPPAQTIEDQLVCPGCKSPASSNDIFCRQCGQRIQT